MVTIDLTKDNYKKEVFQDEIPVLVAFLSTGCGASRMVRTFLDDIAEERAGKIKICKVDIEKENLLMNLNNIKQTPTLYLYKDCEIIERSEVLLSKNQILEMIDKTIAG